MTTNEDPYTNGSGYGSFAGWGNEPYRGGWGPGFGAPVVPGGTAAGDIGGWGGRYYPGNSGTFGTGNFGPQYGGTTGTWGQTMSDREIEEHVYRRLDDDPTIPSTADIQVQSQNHVVTLTGSVRSRRVKQAAAGDAWSSPGVDDVHNHIQIKGRNQQ